MQHLSTLSPQGTSTSSGYPKIVPKLTSYTKRLEELKQDDNPYRLANSFFSVPLQHLTLQCEVKLICNKIKNKRVRNEKGKLELVKQLESKMFEMNWKSKIFFKD